MQMFSKWLAPFVLATMCVAHVQASEFAGPYVGAKYGADFSRETGAVYSSESVPFFGVTAGYNVDVQNFVIGAEAFGDFHERAATRKDGGIDMKLGLPMNDVMPYARLGFTGGWPDTRLHYGLGVEAKFAKHVGVAVEWTGDTSHSAGERRENDSLTLGAHYFF